MPLPDETRAKSAKDLIARFQSSINTNVEPPLKLRHSFGSNEVLEGAAVKGSGSGGSAGSAGTTGRQSLGVAAQPERSTRSPSPNAQPHVAEPILKPVNATAKGGASSDPNTGDSQTSKPIEGSEDVNTMVEKEKNDSAKNPSGSDNKATPSKAVSTSNAEKPKTSVSSTATATPVTKHAKETSSTSTASSSKTASTARATPKPTPTRTSPTKQQQKSPAVPTTASSSSTNDLRKSVSQRAMTPTASSLAKSRAAGVASPTATGSPSTASPSRRDTGSPSPSTSRLMRPTASSATKARSSLGGASTPTTPAKAGPTTPSRAKSSLSSSGARPQSSASKRVTKSPVPPLPAGTSSRGTKTFSSFNTGKEADRSSASATPHSAGVRKSSAAHLGARETSRATPTKVRPPPPASTSAESPKTASVIERLSKPTVASANHARQASAPVSPQKTASPAGSTAQVATGRSPAKAAGAASSPRALKLTPGKSTMKPVSKPKTAEEPILSAEPESPDHKQETATEPDQADIPEIPPETADVQGVQQDLEKAKLDDDDTSADMSQHVQTSSSGSEVPSLSATSTTQPSEATSAHADESAPEPATSASGTPAPSVVEGQEKVFTGFGPDRPHGKIGLPTSSLGENAPVELKLSPSPAVALAGNDFSSKWGTREGTSPGALVSPSAGSSRAVSPSGSNQGTAGETAKKVPIWMRKGGEANATS